MRGRLVTKKIGNVTLDDLARMVADGFAEMATKDEIQVGFAKTATKTELQAMEKRLGGVEDRLGTLETTVKRALHTEYVSLESRVTHIEQKIGISHSP